MNACHGYWWCATCDEPALESCRRSKSHRTEFILGEPIRDGNAAAVKHQAAHTHQFTPMATKLEPDEVAKRFEQMRAHLAK